MSDLHHGAHCGLCTPSPAVVVRVQAGQLWFRWMSSMQPACSLGVSRLQALSGARVTCVSVDVGSLGVHGVWVCPGLWESPWLSRRYESMCVSVRASEFVCEAECVCAGAAREKEMTELA